MTNLTSFGMYLFSINYCNVSFYVLGILLNGDQALSELLYETDKDGYPLPGSERLKNIKEMTGSSIENRFYK